MIIYVYDIFKNSCFNKIGQFIIIDVTINLILKSQMARRKNNEEIRIRY